MIKRTPSRNTRSKGFKGKHVLQICLLLGVCFWLLYQVKHSHDKKKEFEEKDAKITVQSKNVNSYVDFGRKGLHPHLGGLTSDEKHEEDEEEETLAEEEVNKVEEIKHEEKMAIDENKHKEDEQEEQIKTEKDDEREEGNENTEEERENVGNGHGEEERENDGNEHGEAKTEEGSGHDEEEIEEEGNGHDKEEIEEEEGNGHDEEEREEEEGNGHDEEEREEVSKHGEEEREEEGRGGRDGETDERDQQKIEEVDWEDDLIEQKEREGEAVAEKDNREASTEEQDNHEAREVHYRADDASSAVTHDTQNVVIEPEKIGSDSSNEKPVISYLGSEKNSSEINHNEITEGTINSGDQVLKNSTADQQLSTDNLSDVKTEANENLTNGSTGISITSKHNETLATSDSENPHNAEASKPKTTGTEQVSNNTVSGAVAESNSTSTGSDKMENKVAKEITDPINSEPDGSSKTIIPEITEAEVNSGSTRNETQDVSLGEINETQDASQGENSDIENESNGTYENSHGIEADVHDQTDSSIGQDVKDARINLDTLPEDIVEEVNSRDTAAE